MKVGPTQKTSTAKGEQTPKGWEGKGGKPPGLVNPDVIYFQFHQLGHYATDCKVPKVQVMAPPHSKDYYPTKTQGSALADCSSRTSTGTAGKPTRAAVSETRADP